MKTIKVKVFRKQDEIHRYDTYTVTCKKGQTILDLLFHIKENLDETLSFRAFCRSGICGSCALKVNGHPVLACRTQVKTILDKGPSNKLIIEPLDGFKIIKDLIVDIEGKQEVLKRFELWLEEKKPPKNKEFKVLREEAKKYGKETDCILCLTCCSVCETLKENTPFAGPFAFVRTYRFIVDSREKDEKKKERLETSINASIWSCVQCQKCVAFCPKEIAPAQDIQKIRKETIKAGYTETPGARKLSHYLNWVYATGQINRLYLPLDVYDNEKAVREFINFCKEHGVKIWEIPHLPDGFLALRDLIVRALIKDGDIENIDFKKIRKIDEKIEKLLKGDSKCE